MGELARCVELEDSIRKWVNWHNGVSLRIRLISELAGLGERINWRDGKSIRN